MVVFFSKSGGVKKSLRLKQFSFKTIDWRNEWNSGEETLIASCVSVREFLRPRTSHVLSRAAVLFQPRELSQISSEIFVMGAKDLDLKLVDASDQKKEVKKKKKKRPLPSDDHLPSVNTTDADHVDAAHAVDDLNEPTMGEKLASLNLVDDVEVDDDENKIPEKAKSLLSIKPPSADSVHVLLKQALHADDRAMLLNCLYSQDEKVISNSTSLLNPSDVLKLLHSLISIVQSSKGAVLACALPWLRSLLLQHASGIMSQESSSPALNSLCQLIEARVSTFQSALQLSSCLNYYFIGVTDDLADEITPAVYEDKDESDEDENEDAIETDQESEEDAMSNGFSDEGESDAMSE